jgi:hypothetical protein
VGSQAAIFAPFDLLNARVYYFNFIIPLLVI